MARTGRRADGGRDRMTPTPTGQPPGALWYRPKHTGDGKGPRRGFRWLKRPKKRVQPQPKRWYHRFLPQRFFRKYWKLKYWWLWLFVIFPVVMLVGLAATLFIAYETIDIPKPAPLKQTTYVYDRHGRLITTLFRGEDRTAIGFKDMPKRLRQAVIAAEDAGYYQHGGISPFAIIRAAWADITHGGYVQGGSTITQQYVKLVYTGGEKSLLRKVKEAIIAIKLEHKYSKNEILEKYLNTVYLGHGAYGVQSAAKTYFGVNAKDLTLLQDATLAGVIPAPSRFDPIDHPTAGRQQRNRVLNRMADVGSITQKWANHLKKQPVETIGERHRLVRAGMFVDYASRFWLRDEFGKRKTYSGGLRVKTTLDLDMQNAAQEAINSHLPSPDDPAAVLVAIDPHTGEVRAMAGPNDYRLGDFNLAVQGHRSTGSSFKAFTLAAAFEQGISPFSYWDGPAEITIPNPECYTGGEPWSPANSGDEAEGTMSLLSATANSVNTIFAQLVVALENGPQDVVDVAHEMGIQSRLSDVCSITLGTQDVSPLEMTDGYATLAARGMRHYPLPVEEVRDPNGKLVKETKKAGTQVIPRNVADMVTYALEGVIRSGTGTAAYFGRPAAGKTGTAEDYSNAWFCGYVPQLATCVWVGYTKTNAPLVNVEGVSSVYGGTIPAEIWRDFMANATADMPVVDFQTPDFSAFTGHPDETVAPPPPPAPAPTAAPTSEPSESPKPSPSPVPSPSPSPVPSPSPSPTVSLPPPEPDHQHQNQHRRR